MLKKIISFTNQANFPKVSLWAGRLLPEMGSGARSGHFVGGSFSD